MSEETKVAQPLNENTEAKTEATETKEKLKLSRKINLTTLSNKG